MRSAKFALSHVGPPSVKGSQHLVPLPVTEQVNDLQPEKGQTLGCALSTHTARMTTVAGSPCIPKESERFVRLQSSSNSGEADIGAVDTISQMEGIEAIHLPKSCEPNATLVEDELSLYWPCVVFGPDDRMNTDSEGSAEHFRWLSTNCANAPGAKTGNIGYAMVDAAFNQYDHDSAPASLGPRAEKEIVAVKRSSLKTADCLRDAEREFRILHKIRHHHIISAITMFKQPVIDEGVEKISVWTVLFPFAQRDLDKHLDILSEYIERSRRHGERDTTRETELDKLLKYPACLCRATLYLHSLDKIVKHRDIKPANMLIDAEKEILLADFDLAKQYDGASAAVSSGPTKCTLSYAPLHVSSWQQGPRGLEWDVISLAFVLLEILTVALGISRAELIGELRLPTSESDTPVLHHPRALSDGRTATWLQRLKDIDETELPGGMTRNLLHEVIDHISTMMMATHEESKQILLSAYGSFRRLVAIDAEPYCRCESIRIPGLACLPLPEQSTHSNGGPRPNLAAINAVDRLVESALDQQISNLQASTRPTFLEKNDLTHILLPLEISTCLASPPFNSGLMLKRRADLIGDRLGKYCFVYDENAKKRLRRRRTSSIRDEEGWILQVQTITDITVTLSNEYKMKTRFHIHTFDRLLQVFAAATFIFFPSPFLTKEGDRPTDHGGLRESCSYDTPKTPSDTQVFAIYQP